MKQNHSYAYLWNVLINRIEDTKQKIGSENVAALENLEEIKELTNQLSFRTDTIEAYSLSFFFKQITKLIEEKSISRYAACRFDMKNFSMLNHQFGRSVGTEILNEFVVRLQEKLGEDGWVCRIQGDAFVALFRKEYLTLVTEYLAGTVIEVEGKHKKKVTVCTHAGYYEIDEGKTSEEIMDCIGIAWNIAKHMQKVPYVFFNEELLNIVENKKWVESVFDEAILAEEFMVYYQPKVTLKNYRLVGAEALCRWKHEGEVILPYRFIPVLEQSQLICDLDFYVLEHVCRDICRWRKEGRKIVKVSVNLSRVHLGDVDVLERVVEIVDRYEVPHEHIEIELTETTTDVDFRDLKRLVKGLRDEGFSVAVDDFGVGYSSLNLIREMPWEILKIDKSFLPAGNEDCEEELQKKMMLKHIIGMAQNFGIECIAEGVETAEQVTILKENNCYLAQGYLFDKPLPVDLFEERLDDLA